MQLNWQEKEFIFDAINYLKKKEGLNGYGRKLHKNILEKFEHEEEAKD